MNSNSGLLSGQYQSSANLPGWHNYSNESVVVLIQNTSQYSFKFQKHLHDYEELKILLTQDSPLEYSEVSKQLSSLVNMSPKEFFRDLTLSSLFRLG